MNKKLNQAEIIHSVINELTTEKSFTLDGITYKCFESREERNILQLILKVCKRSGYTYKKDPTRTIEKIQAYLKKYHI